jgi:hypothetical protein
VRAHETFTDEPAPRTRAASGCAGTVGGARRLRAGFTVTCS